MSGRRSVRLVDRCEVCAQSLDERPVAERRRCGEVVDGLRSHRAKQHVARLASGTRWVTSDLVFTTGHGTPIEPRTVNRRFRVLTHAANLRPVRVHDLRHGCVSLLLSLGVPPRTVMEIVGHTVMEMTMERYAHVNLDDQRQALDLLDRALS